MIDTLASLRAEIQLECRGDFSGSPDEDTIVNGTINDGIESIWNTLMSVALARFIGADSPVTFTLASQAQSVQLVSIPDPTVAPTVNQVAGGNLVDGAQFWVGYTFVTESGSETNISPLIQSAARNNNNVFQVPAPVAPGQAAVPGPGNAVPPGQSPAVAGVAPTTAYGWNLYAGIAEGLLALQNQEPLPFNVAATEPPTEWQSYSVEQQAPPLANQTADNLAYITHMEIQTPDTAFRAWNQADIDSMTMRRMAQIIPSASPYSNYVWELHNNGRLEFRPYAGTGFTPRYWYIAKPRRLRYDQAQIPYVSIAGVHAAVKYMAKAALYLGVNEFMNAQGWQQAADAEVQKIQMALAMESWRKNSYVSPYLI